MTADTPAKRRPGHAWGARRDACGNTFDEAVARVRWVLAYEGPFETIATSKPLLVTLSECSICGLLVAHWSWFDPEKQRDTILSAYGFDLDALTLMGSAPVCDPFALTQPSTRRDLDAPARHAM